MILKTKSGEIVEFTKQDYQHFVALLLVEFQKEKKLELSMRSDSRVHAAELIFSMVAREGKFMSIELKESFLQTAQDLLEKYNNDQNV